MSDAESPEEIDAVEEGSSLYSNDSSYWSPWKTADALLERLGDGGDLEPYQEVTRQVCHILRKWGDDWAGELKSFLRKTSALLHETEESIVALHHLREWWLSFQGDFIAVDLCSGKGYFSMYLKYLADLYWNQDDCYQLKKIILMDKNTAIHWDHLTTANSAGGVQLELWPGSNLHETEQLLGALEGRNAPLALTGIHLCRMLSPSFLSLVNGLKQRCAYMCLAPCCLPRCVSKNSTKSLRISIHRSAHTIRKENKLRPCYLCQEQTHLVRDCPLLPENPKEKSRLCQEAAKSVPCWNCGKLGHFRRDCTFNASNKLSKMIHLDTSSIMESANPFASYCRVLAEQGLGVKKAVTKLVDTGFKNSIKLKDHKDNWNSIRKSIYIVAYD